MDDEQLLSRPFRERFF